MALGMAGSMQGLGRTARVEEGRRRCGGRGIRAPAAHLRGRCGCGLPGPALRTVGARAGGADIRAGPGPSEAEAGAVLSGLVGRSFDEGHAPGALSPIAYAFLGDAVWELYARTKELLPAARVVDYRKRTEAAVMAEHQAYCLDALTEREAGALALTARERDVVRRGRNSHTPSVPKRLRASREAKAMYAKATALECLVGYLYLTDPRRLGELMASLGMAASHTVKVKEGDGDSLGGWAAEATAAEAAAEARQAETARKGKEQRAAERRQQSKSEPRGFGGKGKSAAS